MMSKGSSRWVPRMWQVKFLSKKFKRRKELIEGDSGLGRRVEASSKETCQKVEDMILQDRHIKFSVIVHELGISAGTVSSTIHAVLMMSMVSSRWVPRSLTPEQKACRQQFSEESKPRKLLLKNYYRRWNMGPLSWSRDQTRVHAMEKQGDAYSQEI